MRVFFPAVAAAALFAGALHAGPVQEFETQFRSMYGNYRAALFGTNAGKQDVSVGAIGKLDEQLSGLLGTYRDAPPPQYADDPAWGATMSEAEALIGVAHEQAGAGDLAEAHETLEGVRDLFWQLHARNGVETFSDRMNAYHAAMEEVLAADVSELGPDAMGHIREQAAVLSYLAKDILAAPPADAQGSEEYGALSAAFAGSVDGLLDAVRSGDAEAVRGAIGALKVPYSKFFLKFG